MIEILSCWGDLPDLGLRSVKGQLGEDAEMTKLIITGIEKFSSDNK